MQTFLLSTARHTPKPSSSCVLVPVPPNDKTNVKKGVNLSIERQINTSIKFAADVYARAKEKEKFFGSWFVVGPSRYTPHMSLFDCRRKNNVTFATTPYPICIYTWECCEHESEACGFYFRCNRQSAYNSCILCSIQ